MDRQFRPAVLASAFDKLLDKTRTTGYSNIRLLVREVTMRDVAQFLKVLADEARLQMLWLLFNHRELCVCDLMEALGITQSKASRHLATLRHAGLVADRKAGAWSYYSLRPPEDALHRALLDTLLAGLAEHPGAARALRDLQAWLERKRHSDTCSASGASGSTLDRGPADCCDGPVPGDEP